MEDKDLFNMQSQYHGRWWPGDSRSHGISSHCVDLVIPEYGFNYQKGQMIISLGFGTSDSVQENIL